MATTGAGFDQEESGELEIQWIYLEEVSKWPKCSPRIEQVQHDENTATCIYMPHAPVVTTT